MNRPENYLAKVHPRTPEWNFNLYVIRMWMFRLSIIQMSYGRAVARRPSTTLVKRWGKVLKEFHLFNMRWFVVVEDKLKSKTTETGMVLTFSLEALRLKPIEDLLQAERIDDVEMFGRCCNFGSWEVNKKRYRTATAVVDGASGDGWLQVLLFLPLFPFCPL
ncbi:hypothetical protein PIB30_019929 [Stylosanthes scabra]|uniref:Uncharacterized protein n=1 Tax=Stylosanthes scabra TaxID=79078 RepID=A0ABU6W6E5_9FABA|nr:hypothetical protein [Stylosanthes scabra]